MALLVVPVAIPLIVCLWFPINMMAAQAPTLNCVWQLPSVYISVLLFMGYAVNGVEHKKNPRDSGLV
jgi:hypothetical protein